MANKQTLTISFVSAESLDDVSLDVELDDVVNESVLGKTSDFVFGESVAFRVYVAPLDTSLLLTPSDGNITTGTTVNESVTGEFITFAEAAEAYGGEVENVSASLDKPCFSGFSATLVSGDGVGSLSIDPEDPSKVLGSSTGIGIYKVSYTSKYTPYSLGGVNLPSGWPFADVDEDESYPVVIMVVGV